MQTFQVDHIIPESLAKKPKALQKALKDLGRPSDFDLNSYENWLPACAPCNRTKAAKVWTYSLLVQAELEKAAKQADKARTDEAAIVKKARVMKAISILMVAKEKDALTPEMIESLTWLADYQTENRVQELALAEEPIRFTPYLEVDRYRFNTIANVARVPGTGDVMNLGSSFSIHGRRLTEFVMSVKFKRVAKKTRRDVYLDVYKERPKYEPTACGQLSDQTALLILSVGKTVNCVVGGNEVTLMTYSQAADRLWIVVSSG